MTLSRGSGHGRVDRTVVGDVGGLAAENRADDADEVIGDVVEDELFGFPFGNFAFEIVAENRFVGADGPGAEMEQLSHGAGAKMAGPVGLENGGPTAFLERGNTEVCGPNSGIVGLVEFLEGDEAVRGQEQTNARNGEQK